MKSAAQTVLSVKVPENQIPDKIKGEDWKGVPEGTQMVRCGNCGRAHFLANVSLTDAEVATLVCAICFEKRSVYND
jgi:hypothetical protein